MEGCDALDRVAGRFITAHASNGNDEQFGPVEPERSKVPMTLGGAITWCRGTEFSWLNGAVVMNIDEVEADDPRAVAEDHRCLLCKYLVECVFNDLG